MNKILFLDTLTTGLNHDRCAIYSLGAILCEQQEGQLRERVRLDLSVRPFDGARINENSLAAGGVTRSRLLYYPTQEEAFDTFMKVLGENISLNNSRDKIYLAGFNASSFDVPFLMNWFKMNQNTRWRDCFYVQTLDIMCLAAFALMEERGQMTDFRLETAASQLGVELQSTDCLSRAEICQEMYVALQERLLTKKIKIEKTDKLIKNKTW